MNFSFLLNTTQSLHVYPQLTIQLLSLKNKKHSPNYTSCNKSQYLLDNNYSYCGMRCVKLQINNYKWTEYFYDEKLHRDDAPAVISYIIINDTKHICHQRYYQHGKLHRDDGPAVIEYSLRDDSTTRAELNIYYQRDVQHRDLNDGPSFINYEIMRDGMKEVYHEEYCVNGQIVDHL